MSTSFLTRLLLFPLFASLLPASLQAQQTVEKMVVETRYLLSLPDQYNKDTTIYWPLVLFLHGSGESGQDIEKVKRHGPPQLVDQGKKFPFILVSPQSEVPSGWDADQLYKLLQHIKKTYRVDNRRIYLTGLSMGGFGTWALAMKHPEEFAAIAPICGGGDTANAWKLRNMPIWCFHGAKDNVVSPIGSINMVKAVGRYNQQVRFTLYPEANHNSWDTTYNNDSLYSWMLAQTRFNYREITVHPSLLKSYQGRYVGPDRDTVQIVYENNSLIAKPGKEIIPLKAAANNVFFLQADKPMDIRFLPDKNKTRSFLFMGDRKLLYRKI